MHEISNSREGERSLGRGWSWIDGLAIFVICVSITSLGLFAFGAFLPKQALLLGASLATVFYAFFHRNAGVVANGTRFSLPLLAALLLFATVFRVEPFPWINGGQDQGVYVSMSSYYQHGGDVFIEDPMSGALKAPELLAVYKSNLRKGDFQPGVYYGGEKDYVFQFYHLHPLWMAMFADLFGDDARVYALTFFSLLSIIFLCLLTLELSESRIAAITVGVLLALNPLHAFFSKWPVTEVVALAFSAMGLYYLARATKLGGQQARWALVIGCLGLSLLFFVRISGFIYLPFLWAVFMAGIWMNEVRGERFGRDLAIYAVACTGLYVLSVFYGLKFSPVYSADIYRMSFGKLAGGHWAPVMIALLAGMVFTMVAAGLYLRRNAIKLNNVTLLQPRLIVMGLSAITGVIFIYSLYQVYQLGYTDALASHPWLGERWRLSGTGIEAVERSTALNWLIYSSPFLVVPGAVALLGKGADWRLALLCVVPAAAFSALLAQSPVLPYQYYYARYLLSEAVPYAIVIFTVVTVGSASARWRKVGLIAALVSASLFGFYTLKQMGAEEGTRPLQVLRQVASHIGEDDVLLLEPSGWSIPRPGVETPLRFYFGLKTFAITTPERQAHEAEIGQSFRNIWLLSPKLIVDERYVLVDRLLHHDKVMERVGHVPLQLVNDFWRQELYLYQMKKYGWPRGGDFQFAKRSYSVQTNSSEMAVLLGDGWHSFEQRHVWSSGRARIVLNSRKFVDETLPEYLVLRVQPYAANQKRPIKVRVTACGLPYEYNYLNSEISDMRIPVKALNNKNECEIAFEIEGATSPKALGHSEDPRTLGIALFSLAFE